MRKKTISVMLGLAALLLATSVNAADQSCKDTRQDVTYVQSYNRNDQNNKLNYFSEGTPSQYTVQLIAAGKDIGRCMADCASEQGICIGQCEGNGQCINNCQAAHGRCVARCMQ